MMNNKILVSRLAAVALVFVMCLSVVHMVIPGQADPVVSATESDGENLPPVFNIPLDPEYNVHMGESTTFSVVVSDPDGDMLLVNWSFGNGQFDSEFLFNSTEEPRLVTGTTVYTSVATGLNLFVIVYDWTSGQAVTSTSVVNVLDEPPGEEHVGYWWHDMFAEPFGEWWDTREAVYNNVEIVSDAYPYIYRTLGPWWTEAYWSSMRLNVMADSLTAVSMDDNPLFLPYLGPERGGFATVDWYMQYLTKDEMQRYPDDWSSWDDGWFVCLNGTAVLDTVAAKAVLGITDDGLDNFDIWWSSNQDSVETAFIDWMDYEANDRLDIYPMYEWPFMPLFFELDAWTYDGHVTLAYDLVSWGMEALMTRWLHDAFMPTEWYFEDFRLHAEIFPTFADIDIDTAVVGAVFAWKDMATEVPSWAWRGMLQDYVVSSPYHPISDFDPYDQLEYLSMYAGSDSYGTMIPYHYTPGAFDLSEGQEMWFEWPEGPQTFIVDGDYTGFTTEEYEMASPYSEPCVSDLPANVAVDPGSRTITFTGPVDVLSWSETQTAHEYLESEWDRLGVLPYGMPWIEFRADQAAPEPQSPVAIIDIEYEAAFVGELVEFNASASYDLDGVIESYTWDFGDGSTGTGMIATHAYSHVGCYNITLTVQDDDGLTGADMAFVEVVSVPVASMMWVPLVPDAGELVTFYAEVNEIVECYWYFGDGANATGLQVEHVYQEKGDYLVVLNVVNVYGIWTSVIETIEVGAIGSGVRGVVVSENQKPLRNVEVEVFLHGIGMCVGSDRTDADGEFSIRGLLPGDYILVASKDKYVSAAFNITVGQGMLDLGTIVLEREKGAGIETVFLAPEVSLPLAGMAAILGLVGATLVVGRKMRKHRAAA